MDAAERWARDLASWAIPPEILDAAPESPWGFDVKLFSQIADAAEHADTPSRRHALERLGEGGSVLDVGCGAGAASLALTPRVGRAVGVDESAGMLAAFAQRAEKASGAGEAGRAGVAHHEITGRWPDVAADAPVCDLVACHHVVYNVAGIEPFLRALTDHARARVVIEMTAEHPLTWMNPLWERFHGIQRPDQPTADTLLDVLAEGGYDVASERWEGQRSPSGLVNVAGVRRRLCLPEERDDDIAAALEQLQPRAHRDFVTIWWDVT